MACELPPALEPSPEPTLPWGEPFDITAPDDRIVIPQVIQEHHSMAKLDHLPQAIPVQPHARVTFCINFVDAFPPLAHSPCSFRIAEPAEINRHIETENCRMRRLIMQIRDSNSKKPLFTSQTYKICLTGFRQLCA